MRSFSRLVQLSFIALTIILISGCARPVAFKQPDTYQHSTAIPLRAAFYMDGNLKNMIISSRAASSGIANRWDIQVGDAVHKYATSYLQNAFTGFKEISAPGEGDYDILIKVADISYNMAGQAAHSDLTFVIESPGGTELFRNQYHADGPSGYGRVFMGGAFAQKSAIRQSTHVVMETIFKNLVDDISSNYNGWGL
jgi:hypothetical protein